MDMLHKNWELFSHGADIGIRGYGASLSEAFVGAGRALTSVVTDLKNVLPETAIQVSCTAPDLELLFTDWINAIIYQMDTRVMLFSEFEVEIQDLQLIATISGEKIDREKHTPAVDIKGATFTELKVEKHDGLWVAQCVVDV